MVNPVPGYSVTTAYNKRGPYWSCNEDANGNGTHTGVDYAAPVGTKVVAARPGKCVYSNHGAAFGYHQIDIVCDDGTRDFYAHMPSRAVANGARVDAGQKIGTVGAEGNVTGAHLHFERHATDYGGWSCSVVRDPAPSINYQSAAGSGGSGAGAGDEDDMPKYAHGKLAKAVTLKDGQWNAIEWKNGDYFDGYGILVGDARISASLAISLSDRAGSTTVQTSWVETESGDAVETYGAAAHGAVNHAVDTRNGGVQKGRRLRARVRVNGGDARLTAADVIVLFWPV